MPYANPEHSFESAARHLFRHINDADALRRNPLVLSFFARGGPDEDKAVMRNIRSRILTESSALRDRQPPSSELRARRRHAIVVALCAGEPARKTAGKLGISIHHYYRERHAVCTEVSRALIDGAPTRGMRFKVADSLKLLFTRAAALRDQGFAGKAVSILQEALHGLSDVSLKPVLRSELARAMMCFGRADRAVALLAESGDLEDLRRSGDVSSQWVYEHHTLTRAQLAMETGHDLAVAPMLEALARSKIRRQQVDEEALDAIIECGNWYCQVGEFTRGRGMLSHAREVSRQFPHVSARQQSAIALLTAHCAHEVRDGFDLEHHWLNEALALSVANGSVRGITGALTGLMQYYLWAGYDDEVLALGQEGLRIARAVEGSQLLELLLVQTVGLLMRTRHWRTVAPLMLEAEKLAHSGSVGWSFLKESQGLYFLRTNKYDLAQAALAQAHEGARRLGNRWLEGLALRDLAIVRHHLGSDNEGVELIRHAMTLLEGHSSAPSLWVTYDAAARLLPDRHITRFAEQIKARLSMRSSTLNLRPRATNTYAYKTALARWTLGASAKH